MITSAVAARSTPLQVALAFVTTEEKLVKRCFEYDVTCSYDELQKLKLSTAATSGTRSSIIINYENGLVQPNFDANIRTQNVVEQTQP